MRLEGSAGQWLQLSIVGYEFPKAAIRVLSAFDAADLDFDANWLVVKGEVRDEDREWGFSRPVSPDDRGRRACGLA
jgi:hypothetical protein